MNDTEFITLRPSKLIYRREHHMAAELLEDGANAYGWGYEMGKADALECLPALTADEMANLWHADYSEGYVDGYDDYTEEGCWIRR